MFRWKILSGVALIFVGSGLTAQTSARPTDPVFTRAQALVSDGNGAAGRALIDSMIAATPPSAPLYPQALFWRASLAASAADAESDYKHIVVDYPLTPQAPDALLRLAQLELARGDRDAALGHLQRIPRDYPSSKSLARANYWIARVLFEKNDIVNGCVANASALAKLDSTEIELRNQIQYQGQRCPLPSAAAVTAVTASRPATTSPDSGRINAQTIGQTQAAVETKTAVESPPVQSKVAEQSKPPVETKPTVEIKPPVETKRPVPPPEANDAKPSIVDPARAPMTAPASASSAQPVVKKTAAAAKSEYSVQIAAYKTRGDADKLTESLKKRGYEARVDVSSDWFRVRVGRYTSERAAESKLREMKTKQLTGFVVRAPDR
jgi:cell division protein FtsN